MQHKSFMKDPCEGLGAIALGPYTNSMNKMKTQWVRTYIHVHLYGNIPIKFHIEMALFIIHAFQVGYRAMHLI